MLLVLTTVVHYFDIGPMSAKWVCNMQYL